MTSDTNTSGSDLADTSSEATKLTDELSDSVDDASTDVAEDVADAEEDGLSEDSSVSSSEEFHEDIGEDSSEGAMDDGLEEVPEDVTDDESATDAPESPGEVASEDVPDDAASDVPEVGPGNGSDMSAREVDDGVETESESTEETEQNELGAKESAEETNAERDGAHGGVSDAWAEESADSQVDDADSAEGESARESVEDGGVIGNASEAASEDVSGVGSATDAAKTSSVGATEHIAETAADDTSGGGSKAPTELAESQSPEQSEEVPLGVSQEPIAEQVDTPTVEAHQPQDALDGREIDPCDDVWNHCDNPENTDYLADSDRARETLSPFRSENWEDMPADDRKGYIEGLADYHADILAVGGKPFIEYYNGSSNDFGAFDPNTNTLMINERNLDDGPEVADTVSHEYRHAYQHQCSENPINERDEIFRDNIVNPIDASVDYQEYRDQPIERDARAYAQRFKNYAQS